MWTHARVVAPRDSRAVLTSLPYWPLAILALRSGGGSGHVSGPEPRWALGFRIREPPGYRPSLTSFHIGEYHVASHTGGGPRAYLAVMAFLPYWPLAVLAFTVMVLQPYWPHSPRPSDSLVMVAGLCVPNPRKLRHGFLVGSALPYAVSETFIRTSHRFFLDWRTLDY